MKTKEDKVHEWERIDALVFQFQEGSNEAADELIKSFGFDTNTKELSKFLNKYFSLLRFGVINFKDRDSRNFIRLFTKNQQLKDELIPFYQYAHTKKAARKVVQRINYRMRHLGDTELIHDLCSILLFLASRYKKQGKNTFFCGYLYKSFKFEVHSYYKYLFKDLHYSHRIEMLEDYKDDKSEIRIDELLKPDLYFKNEKEKLGFNWILGKTATFPFDQLTMFERTILSMYDDKNMTYEEVGTHMGYHRDTIWSKRKGIKNKLLQLLKEPPLD